MKFIHFNYNAETDSQGKEKKTIEIESITHYHYDDTP